MLNFWNSTSHSGLMLANIIETAQDFVFAFYYLWRSAYANDMKLWIPLTSPASTAYYSKYSGQETINYSIKSGQAVIIPSY